MPLPPTNSNVCASSNPESAGPAMAPIHRATILAQVGERRFPETFVWGVATAAPQIEGGAWTDGKGPSIWDSFCRLPGKVHNGDTLDVACDHYHRYKEDFALMARLGVRNYQIDGRSEEHTSELQSPD